MGGSMPTTMIEISTKDGPCTTEVVTPERAGPWPVVIEFYDAAGLRPAQTQIAERIAKLGYVVIQPDLFHRSPPPSSLIEGGITLAHSTVLSTVPTTGRMRPPVSQA
jgi:dienelactone hydrolase